MVTYEGLFLGKFRRNKADQFDFLKITQQMWGKMCILCFNNKVVYPIARNAGQHSYRCGKRQGLTAPVFLCRQRRYRVGAAAAAPSRTAMLFAAWSPRRQSPLVDPAGGHLRRKEMAAICPVGGVPRRG